MAVKDVILKISDQFSSKFLAFQQGANNAGKQVQELEEKIEKLIDAGNKLEDVKASASFNMDKWEKVMLDKNEDTDTRRKAQIQYNKELNRFNAAENKLQRTLTKQFDAEDELEKIKNGGGKANPNDLLNKISGVIKNPMEGLGLGIETLTGGIISAVAVIGVAVAAMKLLNFGLQTFMNRLELSITETRVSAKKGGEVVEIANQFAMTEGYNNRDVLNAAESFALTGKNNQEIQKLLQAAKEVSLGTGASFSESANALANVFMGNDQGIVGLYGLNYFDTKGIGMAPAGKSQDVDWVIENLAELGKRAGITAETFEEIDKSIGRTVEKTNNLISQFNDRIASGWVEGNTETSRFVNNFISSESTKWMVEAIRYLTQALAEIWAGIVGIVLPLLEIINMLLAPLIAICGFLLDILGKCLIAIGAVIDWIASLINAVAKFFGADKKIETARKQEVDVDRVNNPIYLSNESLNTLAELSERQAVTYVNVESKTPQLTMNITNTNDLDEDKIGDIVVRKTNEMMESEYSSSSAGL